MPKQRALSQGEGVERRPLSELASWWKQPAVVHASAPPRGTREHSFGWSYRGGTKADPWNDAASVIVAYDTPEATVETHDAVQVTLAGGYVLQHLSYAISDRYTPPQNARDADIGKPGAKEWELAISPGQTVRMTRWVEGETPVVLFTSLTRHKPEDVKRFVESLRAPR